jgi:hypothetical protein
MNTILLGFPEFYRKDREGKAFVTLLTLTFLSGFLTDAG